MFNNLKTLTLEEIFSIITIIGTGIAFVDGVTSFFLIILFGSYNSGFWLIDWSLIAAAIGSILILIGLFLDSLLTPNKTSNYTFGGRR